uniref:UDP-glucose 6-dehydrogenase n=1 Tax=Gracilinema caldarium TaxID=215591 RepID=A0A7C3IJU4_9SPIR
MAKHIAILGNGYVGLLAAVGLADFGNFCIGVDINLEKINALNAGISPIYEPGVEEYLRRNLESGRLKFTTDAAEAIRASQVLFITVGTPQQNNGDADLTYLKQVVQTIQENLTEYKVIVTKSTVPVGTNRWILDTLTAAGFVPGSDFDVVSNPEFLREGRATQDFFHPDRTVIGCESPRARAVMEDVYRALNLISVPFVWCDLETAELIKYASNAFLATKISFINEMANLAEVVGADIHKISLAMGMDGRISPKFLHPGPGYGGSCFPKDTAALVYLGMKYQVPMRVVQSAIEANVKQKERMLEKLAFLVSWTLPQNNQKPLSNPLEGKTIAILGLAFKQETDDIRESPALDIVQRLLLAGASVRVHDPKAMENFARIYPQITFCNTSYDAVQSADALVLLTEWNEYRSLDLDRVYNSMRNKIILDTRNILNVEEVISKGFMYDGVGRGSIGKQNRKPRYPIPA